MRDVMQPDSKLNGVRIILMRFKMIDTNVRRVGKCLRVRSEILRVMT